MSYRNDTVIDVRDLSKCYNIYHTPRDRLKQFIMPLLRKTIGLSEKNYFKQFWALRSVSFEVKRGETIGIIGRNGSGKSTLLQIICGTLNSSAGAAQVSGRVAALLELGAGFNPEFTGRENIFMNAALLGLTNEQIYTRFDDIVAFADIGEHIEQPVKTYSSGMYVRLAFAVIAHVDADILIIDEALAVGDAVFTQKCMRFIRSFQQRGTLLFVSHDMNAVQSLCRSAIWLSQGQVVQSGTSKDVAEAYLQHTLQEVYGDQIKLEQTSSSRESTKPAADDAVADPEVQKTADCVIQYGATFTGQSNVDASRGWKSGVAEILNVTVENLDSDETAGVFRGGERVRIKVEAVAHQELQNPILGFLVRDRLGQDLFGENTLSCTATKPVLCKTKQRFYAEFDFRLPMLPNGQYAVVAAVAEGDLYNNVQHHWLHEAYILNVSSSLVRWGLVGIPFERLELKLQND